MSFESRIDCILNSTVVLENYINKLNRLIIEEKITVTTIVDIPDRPALSSVGPVDAPLVSLAPPDVSPIVGGSRQELIDRAKSIGDFSNPSWVSQMVNGLKQAGVQGLNNIGDSDQPASNAQIQKLIELIIELINKK